MMPEDHLETLTTIYERSWTEFGVDMAANTAYHVVIVDARFIDDLERGTVFLMEIGDTVLHPRYGVGVIDHIEKRVQDGESKEFFVIPKPSIGSTILVPVETADELGLRPISSADKLEEAIKILAGECAEDSPACALRNLSWNDPLALAQAIRNQATEPKSRYPKVSELHQLKRAKKLLAEELAIVLGMPEDTVTALIDCKDAVPSAISKA